jgi:hypothetical protein
MSLPASLTKLQSLVSAGELRMLYIIGVPRSNTTVLGRILGRHLDGAVLEPAVPNTARPLRTYAERILEAFETARQTSGRRGPVTLAVKDISNFLGEPMLEFILTASAHIVFAIREPAAQYQSLARRMSMELESPDRYKRSMQTPAESFWMAVHFTRMWPDAWRQAPKRTDGGPRGYRRATASGTDVACWRALTRQFDAAATARKPDEITVIDAGLSRLFPDLAAAELATIAAGVSSEETLAAAGVEVAANSMMEASSHWATQAHAADRILPMPAKGESGLPRTGLDHWLNQIMRELDPHYVRLFYDPAHRLLQRVRGAAAEPVPARNEALEVLLSAPGPDEALSRLGALAAA